MLASFLFLPRQISLRTAHRWCFQVPAIWWEISAHLLDSAGSSLLMFQCSQTIQSQQLWWQNSYQSCNRVTVIGLLQASKITLNLLHAIPGSKVPVDDSFASKILHSFGHLQTHIQQLLLHRLLKTWHSYISHLACSKKKSSYGKKWNLLFLQLCQPPIGLSLSWGKKVSCHWP